jgi:hypothetical protein
MQILTGKILCTFGFLSSGTGTEISNSLQFSSECSLDPHLTLGILG